MPVTLGTFPARPLGYLAMCAAKSCPPYLRKQTCAVHEPMPALRQKRRFRDVTRGNIVARQRKRLSRPINLLGGARSKAGRPDATATTNVAAMPKQTNKKWCDFSAGSFIPD